MQTFLPYSSFVQSAGCLDRQRLGKQRVECLQILRTLIHDSRWRNHPAVRMWSGCERALYSYGVCICETWVDLGYRDTCKGKMFDEACNAGILSGSLVMPDWFGWPEFHASHRAALLAKDFNHYSRFGWEEQPAMPDAKGSLPYVWPSNHRYPPKFRWHLAAK